MYFIVQNHHHTCRLKIEIVMEFMEMSFLRIVVNQFGSILPKSSPCTKVGNDIIFIEVITSQQVQQVICVLFVRV